MSCRTETLSFLDLMFNISGLGIFPGPNLCALVFYVVVWKINKPAQQKAFFYAMEPVSCSASSSDKILDKL